MGISTVQSYRGAQIFEAVGLAQDLIDRYFTGTASRIGRRWPGYDRRGNGHAAPSGPWPDVRLVFSKDLDPGGRYLWRRNGEHHLFNPMTIARLQQAARSGDPSAYEEYARLINDQAKQLGTLRGLLALDESGRAPVPLDEVEPWTDIVKRFKTGAMSYGSISKETHETLAIAMNRLGGKSNTGEGGEDPERYVRHSEKRSAIKQVASGRFWGDDRLSHERGRDSDQDGAGGQAGGRRAVAGRKGISLDCQDAPLHAVRRPDFSAAAPRYLFDRRPGAVDPRSEKFESGRAHYGQAGFRSGGGHGGRRRSGKARPTWC